MGQGTGQKPREKGPPRRGYVDAADDVLGVLNEGDTRYWGLAMSLFDGAEG